MKRFVAALRDTMLLPGRAWRMLRRLSGDDAYERYLEHARSHGACLLLDRRSFYVREQERRFNGGPRSCC